MLLSYTKLQRFCGLAASCMRVLPTLRRSTVSSCAYAFNYVQSRYQMRVLQSAGNVSDALAWRSGIPDLAVPCQPGPSDDVDCGVKGFARGSKSRYFEPTLSATSQQKQELQKYLYMYQIIHILLSDLDCGWVVVCAVTPNCWVKQARLCV